ncbi:MAG: hypothetical protein Q8P15_00750 [Nanoarchaeota archaeon]|nr:hypothetical protein [Nanoarchaeota archaeon]
MRINLGRKILNISFTKEPNLKRLRKELSDYFARNLIDGVRVEEFELRKNPDDWKIIPKKPSIMERLSPGDYRKDLESIGKKYGINYFEFASWCYRPRNIYSPSKQIIS